MRPLISASVRVHHGISVPAVPVNANVLELTARVHASASSSINFISLLYWHLDGHFSVILGARCYLPWESKCFG
jgi:hypothetical protein